MSDQTYVALLKRGKKGDVYVSTVLANKKQHWQRVDKSYFREGFQILKYPSEDAAQREIEDTMKSLVGYDSAVLPYDGWLRVERIAEDTLRNMYLHAVISRASCTEITYGFAHTEMEP